MFCREQCVNLDGLCHFFREHAVSVPVISVAQKTKLSFNSFHRPAGWDNEKKIAILHENFTRVKPGYAYEDFIAKPRVRKVRRGKLFPVC